MLCLILYWYGKIFNFIVLVLLFYLSMFTVFYNDGSNISYVLKKYFLLILNKYRKTIS
ncbi:hypothetical protein CZ809_00446 [Photobacterium piscicola]|uniref:Uncharacterized protein n=1 Tax=Photobacterium piscicola TaxID=1378299 RepID=A0A1T5HVV1_9GAMM|nr:hypothetical protein CZ809_00446 [Photobacterium piscicola]